MIHRKVFCLLLVILFFLGGSAKADSILTSALRDIKNHLTLLDRQFSIYENALAEASKYVANTTDETLDSAKKACTEAIDELRSLPAPDSTLTEDERNTFAELGLNMTYYDTAFQSTDDVINKNIKTLTVISSYLSKAPELNGTLEHIVKFSILNQAMDRKLRFIWLNALFYNFDNQDIKDFKTGILSDLTKLSADGLPWETDISVLEAKVSYLFRVQLYCEYVRRMDEIDNSVNNSMRYMMQKNMLDNIKLIAEYPFNQDGFEDIKIYVDEEMKKVAEILYTRFKVKYKK